MAEGCRVLSLWSVAGPLEGKIDPEDKGKSQELQGGRAEETLGLLLSRLVFS